MSRQGIGFLHFCPLAQMVGDRCCILLDEDSVFPGVSGVFKIGQMPQQIDHFVRLARFTQG